MSIRYASLQCNTCGCWSSRLTSVPMSRVSDTPLLGRAHPLLTVPSVPASTRLSCTPRVAPAVWWTLRWPDHPHHPSCTCQAGRLYTAPREAPQGCAPLAARGCRLLFAAVTQRRRRLAGAARLQRFQLYACGTRALWFIRQPHVTWPSLPRQDPMACLLWTPQLVILLEHPTFPRRPLAQARARVPAPLHALACAAVIVRASRGVRQACWQTSWSTGCVPTGDRGAYLRETIFNASLYKTKGYAS